MLRGRSLDFNISKKSFYSSQFIAVAASGFIAAGTGSIANAADDGANERAIEEIVVTARKKEESLKDAPVIITAFGSEQIEQLDITSIDDLSRYTPGLQTSETSGVNGGSIILRGIGNSGSVLPFADSSIGLNIDGMPVSYTHLTLPTIYSV